MRAPRRGLRAWAVLTLTLGVGGLTLSAARPEQDAWYEYYHRARQAIDRSDWDRSIAELESAISLRPTSNRNARTYGMRFERYFPYYLLGVARFGSGHDAEALEALQRELDEGEIQKSDAFAERIRVLMDAIAGQAAAVQTAAASRQIVEDLLAESTRLRAADQPLEAMATLERILAVDPGNAAAAEALREVRLDALEEELASFEVTTRGTDAPAPPMGEITSTAAATLLESKVREIFRRGVTLMSEGNLEGALTRFELTIAFLEDEGWTSRQLFTEATEYKQLVATEVRRAAEAALRAKLAAEAGLPETPPEIMLISPASVDEPVATEIVRLQGVAHDNRGVADVAVLVNGQEWGTAELGTRRRDIRVTSRPAPGSDQGLGTFAQFSKDLVLTEPRNRVVVRATNVSGQRTDLEIEIRVEAEESRVFAAIIGVGDYADPGVPDLAFAAADARAFHEYLTSDLGVPEERIFSLLDSEATFQAMRSLFRTELRRQTRENDQVIIYFAGHGAPDEFGDAGDGDGVEKYFLPHDADPDDISGTGYPMQDLAESLGRLTAARVVYIADACFSGASGGRTFGRAATISDGYLGRLSGASPGRVIISASGANEPSLESDALGHGVFTYFLLDGLRGEADTDGNSVITVPEIFSFVSRAVPENTGRRQHPTMSGSLGGEMVLGRTTSGRGGVR